MIFFYVLALIFLFFPVCSGEMSSGGIALLTQPVGARQIGMGESFIAIADGLDSIYYNPAGLAGAKREMSSTYMAGLVDTYYAFAAYGMGMGDSAGIGMGFGTFQGGTIEIPVDDTNYQTVNIQQDYLITLCYAGKLGNVFNYGLNLKYLSSTLIEQYTAEACALDFGLLYRMPLKGLSAGIVMQNLGTEMKYMEEGDQLPLTYGLGIAYSFEKNLRKCSLSSDIHLLDNIYIINLGLEFSVSDNFILRSGYNNSESENYISFGMGFITNNINIDFGRMMITEFDPMDFITLRLCF